MKIVLRAVFQRFALSPRERPGANRRRSITFSPARSATVLLQAAAGTPAPRGAEATLPQSLSGVPG